MKAVILAAGKGERLKPLTESRPKHLIPIGGKPLLEWIIRSLETVRIKDILIVTNYMEKQIKKYFGDGSAFNLNINYLRQEELLGTANAFMKAKEFVGENEFIGLYGDLYLSPNVLKKLIRSHREKETSLCIIPVENPSQYGIVELDGDKITNIIEKPLPGTEPSNLANTGVYLFTPSIFEKIRETGVSSRNEYEITDSIEALIQSSTVQAVILDIDDWLDIGLPWNLLEANNRILKEQEPKIEGKVEKGVTILGSVSVSKGARVRAGAYIEGPVYIGPDSDIGPNCYIRPVTSIGARVRIGNACEVKNSIIMDDTHIAHLSYIGDSIVGENCNIGAGTITANIRFDEKNIKMLINENIIDSGRRKFGSIIGDNAQTGINVSLLPGVKVGSEAWIAPGLTVYEDVVSRTFLTATGSRLKETT